MRVLLDECLPHRLAGLLRWHEVRTVTQMHWSGRKDGELLELARGRFDVLVTNDQALVDRSGLPIGLAVITLHAASNSFESLVPLVPRLLEALSTTQPGEHIRIE